MKRIVTLLIVTFMCVSIVSCTPKGRGLYEKVTTDLSDFPISFTYNGKSYKGFGDDFTKKDCITESADNGGVSKVYNMKHNPSGADFKLETCVYEEYNAWDYTLYITNNGIETTGLFGDINAIDITFTGDKPVMKGIAGDCGKDMYKPYSIALNKDTEFYRESTSGRPTHAVFPYFNLEYGDGGTFIAIGWSGCWKAGAKGDGDKTHFTGGQYEISTVLAPGETIRTPLIALLNYNGRDEAVNMNLWRRWFIDCNMHKVDGKPLEPIFADFTLSQGQSTSNILRRVKGYANHGVPLDYFWLDAGWYTDAEGNTTDWPNTGTLKIDERRFPDRFVTIEQELAKDGGKLLLWFEPEVVRVDKESFLENMTDFDPSWMLGAAHQGTWLEGQLLDMGNAECRDWITSRVVKILKDANISMYRQDFNVDPAPVWRTYDTENKTGFIENQYVMGYLKYWDTLLEEIPGLRIDSCASGGGRNDLETMRRAVPLQISDYWDGNNAGYDERQATTMSIMQWLPYTKYWMYGDDSVGSFTYRARSCYLQLFPLSVNVMRKDTDWNLIKKLVDEWRAISEYYYSDFYMLTEWSNASNVWRGFEYFDTEKNSGFAQLFRAAENEESEKIIKFHGLKADDKYKVYDTDGTFETTVSGKILMEEGIPITLDTPLYAMVIHIQGE